MKFIKIDKFKCECGNCEYDVINFNPIICVCSKCGKQVSKEFKIEIEESEE